MDGGFGKRLYLSGKKLKLTITFIFTTSHLILNSFWFLGKFLVLQLKITIYKKYSHILDTLYIVNFEFLSLSWTHNFYLSVLGYLIRQRKKNHCWKSIVRIVTLTSYGQTWTYFISLMKTFMWYFEGSDHRKYVQWKISSHLQPGKHSKVCDFFSN